MKLNKLILENFRNHAKRTIEFNGESMLITGPNGIGKSNILEAIHLISTTKSLRSKYDIELIEHEKDFARINVEIEKASDSENLEMIVKKGTESTKISKKLVKIDKTPKSLNFFAGQLNSVLFTPQNIELIEGSPSQRRKYLDSIFFQIDPVYKKAISSYTKAIRQRNKILEKIRDEGKGREQLEFWNDELIKHGTLIQNKRSEFFEFTVANMTKYTKELTHKTHKFEIKYNKSLINKERLKEYLTKEIYSKTTLIGPHRDDFEIYLNNKELASFGSRGQQRTTVLAIKLCELDFISNNVGERPILLLDDIFSELDDIHKDAVNKIMGLQQTIVTSAETSSKILEFKKL